jgi:hypothetical protein
MTLAAVQLAIDARSSVPAPITALLERAAAYVDEFINSNKDNPIAGFVPSDYVQVYHALWALQRGAESGISTSGNMFCEWGSGFGIIACMASMLGFDAIAIEIEPRLVAASQSLVDTLQLPVRVVQGSFVPDHLNIDDDLRLCDADMTLTATGPAAYEELGLDPDDFDCIFAYPWPGEDDIIASLFDRCAARGAMLLSYHGQDGLMLRRKR